ncbi:signal transduction histidine kinase [Luteibacter rhizovicinus]|uniref:histidine kinase n=1 Tax=Luteibacter rhizovicinus TaxID=242606 RepID=A0A4R3YQ84_9GAMM|nr:ATP-binding protein [Luteibacter rhizovicinus]TCV93364.1 signal transduction histidine kinase [Luteibacter rhizovicinus]
MRLTELRRTTGFRLALMFLLLFGTCSSLLFAFVYWQTVGYMVREQEGWLRRESTNFSSLSTDDRMLRLREHMRGDPGMRRPFGEFDATGHWLAGNLPSLPVEMQQTDRPVNFHMMYAGARVPFRGYSTHLPDGHWLVVAQNVHEPYEFEELMVRAMFGAGLLTLIFGLAGAVAVGTSSMRRIDAITLAIRRIVTGDLTERLPVQRGGGDLSRLTHEVNGMLDDLERLVHEVKGVCDSIAHDLRTPLTRLLGGLERALRRASTVDEFRLSIADAIDEVGSLLHTFNALLRISEIEAGARRAGFTQVSLSTVLTDVVEFYQPLAEEKRLSLQFVDDAASVAVAGDASLLFDAVSNLVDNAIKFTPPGGTIQVRLDAAHRQLSVVDSGPGIPPGERKAVLNRFHRSEPSRSTPGNGLGLSLVAVIARLHDMTIEISDATPGCRISLSWSGTEG